MQDRLHALRGLMRGADGLLITNINNLRYLTGFTGSSGFALITKKDAFFVTDFRYKEQAKIEVKNWQIIIEKNRLADIARLVRKIGIRTLGFETGISYEFFSQIKKKIPALKPVKGAVETLRKTKDASELLLIKEAVRRAEEAFKKVFPFIRVGTKERAIALRLEEALKKKGCKKLPFDIIVASGVNSAMPHARATEKRLTPGDLIVIDWGAEAEGYYSDMTRTVLLKGPNTAKKREIYSIVLEANRKAIMAVKDGVSLKTIDMSARDIIKNAGYGEYFGHGTGHGIGLEVHEAPSISTKAKGNAKEGMVFTIEPGIYLPGIGGVRIEDMVVVRKSGADVLTTLPVSLKIKV